MKGSTGIAIGIPIGITVAALAWWAWNPLPPVSSVDFKLKHERDSLSLVASLYKWTSDHWKDSATHYKIIADSLGSIPQQVTINDAVTSMHTAGVDSVKRVLLSEPR